MCVYLFGATSSPACANLALKKTIQSDTSDTVPENLHKNFYVDDCLRSTVTPKDAIQYIEDISARCLKGGFTLKKWISNSREVSDHLEIDQKANTIKHFDVKDQLPTEKALGVTWHIETDSINCNVSVPTKPTTRRNLLSITSSIFDPHRFSCSVCFSS